MKEKGRIRTLEAQPAKLLDLVDYRDGSIVSREIISEKSGTITLFAFDEGQGLSEHTAQFDALVHVLEGEVEITISGRPFRLKQGEAILMPANEPHAVKATEKLKMILTMIRS